MLIRLLCLISRLRRAAITPNTKMIIVNTPHNPVGKVFSRQELEGIAALAEEFDLQVMSDEVVGFCTAQSRYQSLIEIQYEALVFDGKEHVRFATLPRMWERTVTVGSAGSALLEWLNFLSLLQCLLCAEMFAATGWRVGWLIGPESIIGPSLAAQTRIVFCTNSPLQEAAAAGLEEAKQRKYFEQEVTDYSERRQILVDAFDKLGAKYTLPEGTYFILLVRHIFYSFWVSHGQPDRPGYLRVPIARRLSLPRHRQGTRSRLQVSAKLSA